MIDVPYFPVGQHTQLTAYRTSLTGILHGFATADEQKNRDRFMRGQHEAIRGQIDEKLGWLWIECQRRPPPLVIEALVAQQDLASPRDSRARCHATPRATFAPHLEQVGKVVVETQR